MMDNSTAATFSALYRTTTEQNVDNSSHFIGYATAAVATLVTRASQASSTAVLMRWACYSIMGVLDIVGNSLNLAVVATTPRLHTKTNYILASLMAAELVDAFFLFEYVAVNGFVFFNGGNCKNNVLVGANWAFQKAGIYIVAGADSRGVQLDFFSPYVYSSGFKSTPGLNRSFVVWHLHVLGQCNCGQH